MFFCISVGCSVSQESMKLSLPSIFGNNMVLQRNREVPFWGTGIPGTKVILKTGWGKNLKTRVNDKGEWHCKVKTPQAGGPYTMDIEGEDTKYSFSNVLIGEVWLCSGQSNMEMPVQGWPPSDTVNHAEQEIKNAHYPSLRLFTVKRAISVNPQNDCQGEWISCSPENIRNFSATAYFFGRKIHTTLGIPVGLIHSSWGGTPAEAWTAKSCLQEMGDFRKAIDQLNSIEPEIKSFYQWLSTLEKVDMSDKTGANIWQDLDFNDLHYSAVDINTVDWPEMDLPVLWEQTGMGEFDGMVWFRKEVHLPETWLGRDLMIELGPIDDMDRTYVNGHYLGGYEKQGFWQTPRIYRVKSEENTLPDIIIAVRVLDTQGGGGIYGKAADMKIYPVGSKQDTLSLAGTWKYLPVAEYINNIFYIYGKGEKSYAARPSLSLPLTSNTPTLLYNAMIHPLCPFSLRGVIWYQGEANVDRPYQYRTLFPLMITCWRNKWDQGDFPFYYVQIAPYEYGENSKSQLLREAQLQTLSLPHTGMVVITDIGNPRNIHPGNKQDVGKRLAKWALAKDYGYEDMVYSGPLYESMEVENQKIRLHFDHCGSGLQVQGDALNSFTIAGEDRKFYPARAEIENNTVVVWSPAVAKPAAVRFGWSNTPEPNLFNQEGLPASPFRTDNWDK